MKYALLSVLLLGDLAVNLAMGGQMGGLIGEPSPPLTIKEWIKGKPVEVKPGTNIFVVEIWSTTGPASRASLTNLNSVQKRFRTNGVIVAAISDESPETLKPFVQRQGTNVEFAIGADDARQTSLGYMLPVGRPTIPCAFVVGTNATLLWYGHPLRGLDKVLEDVVAGHFDIERAKRIALAARQTEQYLMLASRGDPRAKPAGQVLLVTLTNDVAQLCSLAMEIATRPRLAKRDFALAAQAVNQAEKYAPTNTALVMISRAVVLFQSGKRDEGLMMATQALNSAQAPNVKTNVQWWLTEMQARESAIKARAGNANTNAAPKASDHQVAPAKE